MPDAVEFHFQEFFRGEEVRILVNGEPAAAFTATTRPQIGLAHVQPVQAGAGDRVTVCIDGVGERSIDIEEGVAYWIVNLVDGALTVVPGRDSPRYM